MRIKSKKGMILYYLVIFGFIMALSYYFILSINSQSAQKIGYVGKFQLDFLKEVTKANNQKFYLEQAAKLSAKEAALGLSYRGGFKDVGGEALDCGVKADYNFWNQYDNWCKPDYKGNFIVGLNAKFTAYLSTITNLEIGYDYFVRNTTIVGTADSIIVENSPVLYAEVNADFHTRPSFHVDVDYDVSEYEGLFSQAQELVSDCRGQSDLSGCVNAKLDVFNQDELQWKKGVCSGQEINPGQNKTLFCVTGKSYRVFDEENQEFKDKEIQYRFGLDFSDVSSTVST